MSNETRVHVHLSASDLAKSRQFYTRLFGEEPVKEKPGYVKFLPSLGPLNLAVSQGSGRPEGGAAHHFGIQVESSEIVRRELNRVQEAGLGVRVEMDRACCYANQDKFWVRDPDGVEWEVYHLNFDTEAKEDSTACDCVR